MAPRLELQAILVNILGSENVYFQPPANIRMSYPCIRYRRDFNRTQFADNHPFLNRKRYLVTVIDRNPDSQIPDEIGKLPFCLFDRHYVSDDLNHDVYKLFF